MKDIWRARFLHGINYKTPNFYCLRTKCAEETQYISGGKGAGEDYLKNYNIPSKVSGAQMSFVNKIK